VRYTPIIQLECPRYRCVSTHDQFRAVLEGYIHENTIPTPPPSADMAPDHVADSCHLISQRPYLI
jgi:hypothetical protein